MVQGHLSYPCSLAGALGGLRAAVPWDHSSVGLQSSVAGLPWWAHKAWHDVQAVPYRESTHAPTTHTSSTLPVETWCLQGTMVGQSNLSALSECGKMADTNLKAASVPYGSYQKKIKIHISVHTLYSIV